MVRYRLLHHTAVSFVSSDIRFFCNVRRRNPGRFPRLGARESAETRIRAARRGGAPRCCARRAAHAHSARKAHASTRKWAEGGGSPSFQARHAPCARARAEEGTRVAGSSGAPRHCARRFAHAPLLPRATCGRAMAHARAVRSPPPSTLIWLVPCPGVFYRRGLLQKTQTRKMPDLAVVARTPFWSFFAGQRRIGPGQITDGT